MGLKEQRPNRIGHISVLTLDELKNKILNTGLKIKKVKRGFIVYGSKWFDEHQGVLGLLLITDRIFDGLKLNKFTWDLIIEAVNP